MYIVCNRARRNFSGGQDFELDLDHLSLACTEMRTEWHAGEGMEKGKATNGELGVMQPESFDR